MVEKHTPTLCEDCPPNGYPTDITRCEDCPRRAASLLQIDASEMPFQVSDTDRLKTPKLTHGWTGIVGAPELDADALKSAKEAMVKVSGLSPMWGENVAWAGARAAVTVYLVNSASFQALKDYALEITKTLTGLSGGGSEMFDKEVCGIFTADLPRCAERIRARHATAHELLIAERKASLALREENERLTKDRNIQKAHSALRGRILQEIRNKIGPLVMSLEDEGDRIYLGSTNDKDWLAEIEETIFELDDEVWAAINREEADPYQDLYDLRVNKIPALNDEMSALAAQNEWLKDRLSNLQLPSNSPKNIEEWLEECGMPTARAALNHEGERRG